MTVELDLDTILHQRIIDKCMSLYQAGQFSCAALESMKQVELALKEISRTCEKNLRKKNWQKKNWRKPIWCKISRDTFRI